MQIRLSRYFTTFTSSSPPSLSSQIAELLYSGLLRVQVPLSRYDLALFIFPLPPPSLLPQAPHPLQGLQIIELRYQLLTVIVHRLCGYALGC